MNIDLTGKTAFVTGGSKGIGKAIAETLVDCGANVGVMARGKEELDAAVGLSTHCVSSTRSQRRSVNTNTGRGRRSECQT